MNEKSVPNHVVIIPDGNRRWAKEHGNPASFGHFKGYERIKELISYAKEQGISYFTIWAFSTENWSRSKDEVDELLSLITQGFDEIHKEAHKAKTRIVHLGRKDRLGDELMQKISLVEEETKGYTDFCVALAIDYGGEDELRRAEEQLLVHKELSLKDFLDTTRLSIPNPDLIIRTSGECRTSGFMPLQSTYAEWIFEKKLFPDFDTTSFGDALEEYRNRKRRFGK